MTREEFELAAKSLNTQNPPRHVCAVKRILLLDLDARLRVIEERIAALGRLVEVPKP